MKKIFHKNQIIITSLAVLIAVAGYISYDRSSFGKNKTAQASANGVEENYDVDNSTYDIYDEIENAEDLDGAEVLGTEVAASTENGEQVAAAGEQDGTEEILNPGETVLTGSLAVGTNYAATVKLNREQVRSKNKSTLKEIIDDTNITDEQKKDAIDKMIAMTDISEREVNAESLLLAKGFTNVVVSICDGKCDVVLDMGDVTDAKRAQVEDIVKRKTGIEAPNIVITTIENKE